MSETVPPQLPAAIAAPAGAVPARASLGTRVRQVSRRVRYLLTLNRHINARLAVILWLTIGVTLTLALGWNWLAAAGLSSVVLGFLPCAAMCALGWCAGRDKRCSSDKQQTGSRS